jgi:hypothetical protein
MIRGSDIPTKVHRRNVPRIALKLDLCWAVAPLGPIRIKLRSR